jgi:hypothetical protein
MKKYILPLLLLSVIAGKVSAQNTFPTTANSTVVIGTTNILDVNGATRLRNVVEMSNNQFFALNAYNNATAPAGWKYRVAGFASSFVQDAAGKFTFNLGGTASSAINTSVVWRPVYTILNNGNFGIGAINPGNNLEITGALNSSGLRFTNLKSTTAFSTINATNGRALSVNALGDVIMVPLTPIDSTLRKFVAYEGMGTGFGATQKISILNSGLIGIGITTPTAKLEVFGTPAGGTNFKATGGAAKLVIDNNATGYNYFDAGINIFRNYAGVERMRIDGANGNIGIGNIVAQNRLEINSDTLGKAGLRFTKLNANSTALAANGKALSLNAAGDVILVTAAGGTATIDSTLRKAISVQGETGSFGTNQKIKILSNGNVGFGNNLPTSKIEIGTNVTDERILIKGTVANAEFGTTPLGVKIGTGNNKAVYFTTNDAVRMRIDSVGNVGFKSNNPLNTIGLGSGNTGIGFYSASTAFNAGKIAEIKTNEQGAGYGDLLFNTYGGGTGGGERMRISATGNVGIGTTSPSYKLSFGTQNDQKFALFENAGGLNMFGFGYNSVIGTTDIYANGIVGLSVKNGGNVGIGTTTPAAKLDINSTTNDIAIFKSTGDGGIIKLNNDLNKGLTFITYKSTYSVGSMFGVGANGSGLVQEGNGPLGIGTFGVTQPLIFGTNSSEKMRLTSDGNLGIGTTTPTAKLDITAAAGTSGLKLSTLTNTLPNKFLTTDATGNVVLGTATGSTTPYVLDSLHSKILHVGTTKFNSWAPFNVNQTSVYPYSAIFAHTEPTQNRRLIIGYDNGGMALNSSSATTGNATNLLLNPLGGNVGIGTNSPTYPLHVIAPIANTITAAFRIVTGAKNPGLFISNVEATGVTSLDFSGTTGYSGSLKVGGIESMSFLANNNVGVGTSNPTRKLHVVGGTGLGISDAASNGVTTITNDGSATTLQSFTGIGTASSDIIFTNNKNNLSVTEKMRITGSGNVGIGTNNPTKNLTIADNFSTLRLESISSPTGYYTDFVSQYDAAERFFIKSGDTKSIGNKQIFGSFPHTYLNDYYGLAFTTGAFTPDSTKVRMFIANNGNVGIGSKNPQSKLEIASTNNTSGLRLAGLSSTATPAASNGKVLSVNPTGDVILVSAASGGISNLDSITTKKINFSYPSLSHSLKIEDGVSSPNATHFRFGDGSGWKIHFGQRVVYNTTTQMTGVNGNIMTLDDRGRVGIGTSTPQEKFVVETAANKRIQFTNASSSISDFGTGGSAITFSRPDGVNAIAGIFTFNTPSDNSNNLALASRHDISFATGGNDLYNSATDKLRIKANGNVGIGTITPETKLEVSSDVSLTSGSGIGQIRISGATNKNKMLSLGYTTDNIGFIQSLENNVAYNILALNPSGGSVGIGASAPNAKLQVSTNIDLGISDGFKILGFSDTKALINIGDDNLVTTKFIRTSANVMKMVTSNHLNYPFGFVGNYNFEGNVGFGVITMPAGYKLAVGGNIIAEKVKVRKQSAGWPDFVFKKDYKLMSLPEIEAFVNKNSHLPEIPSAAEVEKEGQDLGEMNRLLLKKVEELTLYLIEQNKEIKTIKDELKVIKEKK